MKKMILVLVAAFAISGFAQIKNTGFTPEVRDGMINQNSPSLFGFLNSDKFTMNHSFGMSVSSFGSNSLALGVYTNSMMYKFSNSLNAQLEVSLIESPYSTLGKDFQNNINGLYITKAAVNFKPWKDVNISLQYRNLPNALYNPYYGNGSLGYDSYGSSLFRDSDLFFGR